MNMSAANGDIGLDAAGNSQVIQYVGLPPVGYVFSTLAVVIVAICLAFKKN